MSTISNLISIINSDINGYAVVILIFSVLMIAYMWMANRDPQSGFEWVDMIMEIDQTTGKKKASSTKILQLIGGLVGTFVVVKLTLQNAITPNIFVAYLAYVASVEGFTRLLLAKYGVQNTETTKLTRSRKPQDKT